MKTAAQGLPLPLFKSHTLKGNPQFDEFLFYENDVYNNGIPEGAFLQSAEIRNISGQWKYCLTFNRTLETEERIDEIGLAEITFNGENAVLILHPRQIRYGTDVSEKRKRTLDISHLQEHVMMNILTYMQMISPFDYNYSISIMKKSMSWIILS